MKWENRLRTNRPAFGGRCKTIRLAARTTVESLEGRTLLGAAAGSLDPTFGANGVVNSDPTLSVGGQANAIAIQSNGDIVIGGDNAIARLLPDGQPDETFGTPDPVSGSMGAVGTPSPVNGLAIESNGDIVAVMGASVVRYTPSGALDPTFGSGGVVNPTVGAGVTNLAAIAIQSNGQIVVAGSANVAGQGSDFAVFRLNSDGSADTTFAGTGGVVDDLGGNLNDYATSLAASSSGKITVGGYHYNSQDNADFAVAQFNSDGSIDTSFNNSGNVITDFGGTDDFLNGVAVNASGQIVAVGSSGPAQGGPTEPTPPTPAAASARSPWPSTTPTAPSMPPSAPAARKSSPTPAPSLACN